MNAVGTRGNVFARVAREIGHSFRRTAVLTKKELGTYLVSPGTYVVLAILLFVQIFFLWTYVRNTAGEMRSVLRLYFGGSYMFYLTTFFLPAVVTMRLFAEEKKKGTIEMLAAAPVADHEIVLGKFLAACGVIALFWLPSVLFFFLLDAHAEGTPDWGMLQGSLLGVALVSAFLISIGLVSSAVTADQVVAAILSVILTLLYMGMFAILGDMFADAQTGHVARVYNPFSQFGQDFSQGIVDTRHVVGFSSMTALCLFATLKIFESRKWQ